MDQRLHLRRRACRCGLRRVAVDRGRRGGGAGRWRRQHHEFLLGDRHDVGGHRIRRGRQGRRRGGLRRKLSCGLGKRSRRHRVDCPRRGGLRRGGARRLSGHGGGRRRTMRRADRRLFSACGMRRRCDRPSRFCLRSLCLARFDLGHLGGRRARRGGDGLQIGFLRPRRTARKNHAGGRRQRQRDPAKPRDKTAILAVHQGVPAPRITTQGKLHQLNTKLKPAR